MISTKRSRFEIMATIIQDCLSPKKNTQIRYICNLNFTKTNDYLTLLTSLKLLSRKGNKYEATEKGLQFLSEFNQINKILKSYTSSPAEKNLLKNFGLQRFGLCEVSIKKTRLLTRSFSALDNVGTQQPQQVLARDSNRTEP